MYVYIYVCAYVCMYVYMYVRMYIYACMYVCMHVCMYVCMHPCFLYESIIRVHNDTYNYAYCMRACLRVFPHTDTDAGVTVQGVSVTVCDRV